MKKITAGLLALIMLTGCSNSKKDDNQTLFVENNKEKYALVNYEGEKKTKFIYDNYEKVGDEGYIVIKGKKYGYLLDDGKQVIDFGKYTKLETIDSMLIGYDKNNKIVIIDAKGKELYREDKKTKIKIAGLPIIKQNKQYTVIYGTGEELVKTKKEIISAYALEDYAVVNYKKTSDIYNFVHENQLVDLKIGDDSQLMDQNIKKGYLLYNRTSHKVNAVNNEGKILFTSEVELDDLYYDEANNIVGVKNQTTYLFDKKGEAKPCNSYYYNAKNYIMKNKELVYGPHKFVKNNKEKEIDGIQLDPLASFINNKIFPVYVREKGFQYYDFGGKKVIKDTFVNAQTFDENGLAIVAKKKNKYYLINEQGEKISNQYARIDNIGEGYYAGYITNSKYEVIDFEGNRVIEDYFMNDGFVFTYTDDILGILNKSGTSYVYDMEEYEVVFSVEGDLEFNDDGYFVTIDNKAYYSLDGEKIYKR